MTHEERIRLAGQLAEAIVAKRGADVLAVFVTSSTAKGLDRAHSDLELTAVFRDGVEVEEQSYVYRGILIEISCVQESRILRQAERVTARWPLEADEYRGRLVLFERNAWTGKLAEAIRRQESADFSGALKTCACGLIESRDKMRNVILPGEERNLRLFAMWVAHSACELVLFLNRRYMTTTTRFLAEAAACPARPEGFEAMLDVLLGVAPSTPADLGGAAERMTASLLALAAEQGVTPESDDLRVG